MVKENERERERTQLNIEYVRSSSDKYNMDDFLSFYYFVFICLLSKKIFIRCSFF